MGKNIKVTGVRRLDVTLTELGEIAWALDDLAIRLDTEAATTEDVHASVDLRTRARGVRSTRERIAPRNQFAGNPDAWKGTP